MKTWQERELEAWKKSEHSKKGTFYISFSKWLRLSSRICLVKATIHLMGMKGEYEVLKLDSAHFPIGMSSKSLDKYVRKYFVKAPLITYWVAKWTIKAY